MRGITFFYFFTLYILSLLSMKQHSEKRFRITARIPISAVLHGLRGIENSIISLESASGREHRCSFFYVLHRINILIQPDNREIENSTALQDLGSNSPSEPSCRIEKPAADALLFPSDLRFAKLSAADSQNNQDGHGDERGDESSPEEIRFRRPHARKCPPASGEAVAESFPAGRPRLRDRNGPEDTRMRAYSNGRDPAEVTSGMRRSSAVFFFFLSRSLAKFTLFISPKSHIFTLQGRSFTLLRNIFSTIRVRRDRQAYEVEEIGLQERGEKHMKILAQTSALVPQFNSPSFSSSSREEVVDWEEEIRFILESQKGFIGNEV